MGTFIFGKQVTTGKHVVCRSWQLVREPDLNVPGSVFAAIVAVGGIFSWEENNLGDRNLDLLPKVKSQPRCSLVPGVAQVGSEVVDALEAVGAIGDSVDTLLATGPLISLAGQERSNRLKLNLGFSHELETMAAIFFVTTDTV